MALARRRAHTHPGWNHVSLFWCRYRNQYPILGLLGDDYQVSSPVREAQTIVIERTGETVKQVKKSVSLLPPGGEMAHCSLKQPVALVSVFFFFSYLSLLKLDTLLLSHRNDGPPQRHGRGPGPCPPPATGPEKKSWVSPPRLSKQRSINLPRIRMKTTSERRRPLIGCCRGPSHCSHLHINFISLE